MAGAPAAADQGAPTGAPAEDAATATTDSGRKHEKRETVDFATAITVDGVAYGDDGRLVATKGEHRGKPIALSADATDPDVGWTAQHGRGAKGSAPGVIDTTPDQTYHPSELPNPVAALVSGQLPQNVGGLNIDENKFENKKPMEA